MNSIIACKKKKGLKLNKQWQKKSDLEKCKIPFCIKLKNRQIYGVGS